MQGARLPRMDEPAGLREREKQRTRPVPAFLQAGIDGLQRREPVTGPADAVG